MLEIVGDIWDYTGTSVLVITTNGSLTPDGRAILGRGVAKQAALRFSGLAEKLGRIVSERGNHVINLGDGLVSFPVEETAWSIPDLQIISRSAKELRELADAMTWQKIVVPRPGCGGGGLAWEYVKPVLIPWFDDRFIVISQLQ